MLNLKYRDKLIKKMGHELRYVGWLNFKATCLTRITWAGMDSIVFMCAKLHWIDDNKPIQNPLLRAYVKGVFDLAMHCNYLTTLSRIISKAVGSTLDNAMKDNVEQDSKKLKGDKCSNE